MIKDVLDYIAVYLIRVFVWLLAVLPAATAKKLARIVIGLLPFIVRRFSAVALRNLELAFPERTKQEQETIYRKSLEVLAFNLWSFAHIPRLSKEEAARLLDYQAAISLYTELKTRYPDLGLLGVAMHFGPFEMFIQLHALLYRPISILVRGTGLARLDQWWNGRRAFFGNDIFWRSGGYREIVSRLKRGGDVTLLCDQNVKRNHAVFVNFFGKQAATTKTVALASLETGSPVVLVAAALAGDRIQPLFFSLGRAIDENGDRKEKIERFTLRMNACMEEIIRCYPEQWFWIHRRWKTRPEGEKEDVYDS